MNHFIKLIISLILIALLFNYIDIKKTLVSLSLLKGTTIIYALLVFLIGQIIYTFKWYLILDRKFFYTTLFQLNMIAAFYSTFLPGQVAGDLIKGLKLAKNSQDKSNIAFSVIFDRVTGLLGLLLTGVVGISLTNTEGMSNLVFLVSLFFIASFGLIFISSFPFFYNLLDRFLFMIKGPPRLTQFFPIIKNTLKLYQNATSKLSKLSTLIFLGFLFQLTGIFIIDLIAYDLRIFISIWDWMWVFTLISIAVILPLSIGGLGIRELGFVGLLSQIGVDSEKAIVISLLIFAINLLGALIGGILELFSNLIAILQKRSVQ